MIKALLAALAVAIAALGTVLHVAAAREEALESRLAAQTALADRLAEAAKQAQERSKSDRKVLVARQAKIASQARDLQAAQEALKTALQAEKEWNDTQVPTRVREALTAP